MAAAPLMPLPLRTTGDASGTISEYRRCFQRCFGFAEHGGEIARPTQQGIEHGAADARRDVFVEAALERQHLLALRGIVRHQAGFGMLPLQPVEDER
jgi:hypothetical protein